MIDILIFLLVPAVKCANGGSRNPWHILAALIATPVDMILAQTTWRFIAGPTQGNERTISDTLERLCKEMNNPDQPLFWQIGLKINRATGYPHIKAVL